MMDSALDILTSILANSTDKMAPHNQPQLLQLSMVSCNLYSVCCHVMKYSDFSVLTTIFQAVRGDLTRVQLLCVISTGLHSVRYRPDLLTSPSVQGKLSPPLSRVITNKQSFLPQVFWPPSSTSSPAAP